MTTFRPFLIIPSLLILLALALTACGPSASDDRDDREEPRSQREESPTESPSDRDNEESNGEEPRSQQEESPTQTNRAAFPTSAPDSQPDTSSDQDTNRRDPAPILPAGSVETDRQALEALYHATDGPNWYDSENWLTDAPLNEWAKVTTDENGRVVKLNPSKNGLTGEIPPELGHLPNLAILILHDNQLTGEIPPELGHMPNLRGLNLNYNQLTGKIPPELAQLSNLEALGLHSNQLTGEVPPELGNLSNLEALVLSTNQLTGEIPPELGNLSNLASLDISNNQLTGCVPAILQDQLSSGSNLSRLSNLGGLPFCP